MSLRVLLVEDEAMVAFLIEDMLTELGHQVIGPVPSVAAALRTLETEAVDVAVLDVNVGGETVFPVADRLIAVDVPFVFSTGYGAGGIPAGYGDRPVAQKPYDVFRLKQALTAAVDAA